MRKNLQLFIVVLMMANFYSCNSGGKGISEVKLIPVKSGNDYQYIDQEGKIIINPQFREATVFRNGMALVMSSGNEPKWGYITENGQFAITPNYKYATVFSDDLAWVVQENGAPTAINKLGEIKFTLQDAKAVLIFKEGQAAYKISDGNVTKWGFVDKEGKIKINPQFSQTGSFSNGKCAVANQDGKWGYIDYEGKIVINYQFDNAKKFINGKAVVASGSKYGLIDENGKYLINPQFSEMIIDGDMFLINQNGKYGWCDNDGKIIINPQFSAAYPFLGNKLAAVQSGNSFGYIDRDGKIVINPQFDRALPFNGKLALVNSSNKIGFIDKEGKYVINPQFDEVSEDLVYYMIYGSSDNERVSTDFFDVGIIIERLKKDITENSVAGMNFETPIKDIFEKYAISTDPYRFFNYYSTLTLIKDEIISENAILDFSINAGIYDYVVLHLESFNYQIRLKGIGLHKAQVLLKEFETEFNSYVKDSENSSANYLKLVSSNQIIAIWSSNDRIEIKIYPER